MLKTILRRRRMMTTAAAADYVARHDFHRLSSADGTHIERHTT